jgi:D-citramalate synthase
MDEKAGLKFKIDKGSMNHLTHQLKKTPEQHFTEIAQTIALASANNIASNVYLEDCNGMRNSQTTYFNS